MEEEWRDIPGFKGYQVSNLGRVRTYWYKRRAPTGYGTIRVLSDEPREMNPTDDGNGYLQVNIRADDGIRYTRKVHKLVAALYLPTPLGNEDWTIDHIKSGPEGKLDNSVCNLRWISRGDNIRKAYDDGMLKGRIARSRKMVVLIEPEGYEGEDTRTYFPDIHSAAEYAGVHYTTISHLLNDDKWPRYPLLKGRWYVEYADQDEASYFGQYFYDEEGEYHAGPYYSY